MTDIPNDVKKVILNSQLAQYRQSIYLVEITHKVNKRLGNADKLTELEKELVRLNKEMDMWQGELDALSKDETK